MAKGFSGVAILALLLMLPVGCGQSSTPAPAPLDLITLGVSPDDRVMDVAREGDDLYIVARPTNAPRHLVVGGTVRATAPGFRAADALAVASNGVYAWTPVEGGPIVLEDSSGRIEIAGTNGLGIDDIEVAEPHILILAHDGSNKRLMVYDKAQGAIVADELLTPGTWMMQHEDGTPTWTVPRVNDGQRSQAPLKFRDPDFPVTILRRGSWGSGGWRQLGFGYRDQPILVPVGSRVNTVQFIGRNFALPRSFDVSESWLFSSGVLLFVSERGNELIAQPLAVTPNPMQPATVYRLPDAMAKGGVDLHSDMDDGVVFISGGGLLLEYDLATETLKTPQ